MTPPGIYSIHPPDFTPETNIRAIGGIQLYRGSVARERGYLPDHPKWQRPARKWERTFCDSFFRRELGTRGVPVDVVNLYRLRHSKRGRTDIDVSL